MALSLNLLECLPDRWRNLLEMQVICDTDVLPVEPPEGMSVPTYYPETEEEIFTHADFSIYSHGELNKFEHEEMAGYTGTSVVYPVTNIHTLQYLWDCMDQELNNRFISSYETEDGADEYTCSRWEKMLGITAPNDATLDDRRFAIIIRLFQRPPYTIRSLQALFDDLLGAGESVIIRDVGNKTIKVVLDLSSRFKNNAVREFLENMVPADMILNIEIAYTTYKDLEPYTHKELEPFTHEEIVVTEFSEVLPKTEV